MNNLNEMGMISAIGVRNIVENKVDLTKSRNLIIAGVIFVCGLGFSEGITYFSIAWADSTWRAVYIIYFILSFQIIPESLAFKIQLYFNLILL